jgi:hypothetical protein
MRDHSISDIRSSYKADEELREEDGHIGYFFYYGKSADLLDRVSLVSVDDGAIYYAMKAGPQGYDAFRQVLIMSIPRVFLPDKDKYLHTAVVNDIGRQTGILNPSDESTFIAYSSFGPSFYMGGWWAVSVLTFVIMSLLFIAVDSFYGDARVSLYCLITIAGNLHGAPEMILPSSIGVVLHYCIIATFTLWMLRRLSVIAQVFIQRYGWYEKSPESLAVPRPAPIPREFLLPGAIAPAATPT